MCPVLADRTREQIRVAIGYNLGAVFLSTADSGDSASVVDGQARGNVDTENGKWIVATSGANDGEIRQVTDTIVSNNGVDMTVDDFSNSVSTMTYERWSERYNPAAIHEFINAAITGLYGRAYNPDENITLFADGDQTRFDIPSGFSMINRLEYRSSVKEKVIDSADSQWTADTDVTTSTDDQLKKRGKSNKMVLASGLGVGDVMAYNDITSINISDYTHVEFWTRCSKATSAGDLVLQLGDAAALASRIETLDFPALAVDTWTFCRLELENADLATAIVSVGVENNVDIGTETVWIDDIRAVHNDEAIWTPVPRRLWHIDKNNRHLILSSAGRSLIGYSMLKIVGGDEPTLLTTDANTNEVSDDYVIAKATALAMSAYGPENERTERQIAMWEARASQAYRRLPMLTNVREVE
jgi:hypothetical protein